MAEDESFEVATKTIFWTVIIFVLTLAFFGFAFLLGNFVESLTAVPPEAKAETLAARFVNAPECFAFFDDASGKVLVQAIDVEKFTAEQLRRCYAPASVQEPNVQLALESAAFERKELHTQHWLNVEQHTLSKPVRIWYGGRFVDGVLTVYVQENLKIKS